MPSITSTIINVTRVTLTSLMTTSFTHTEFGGTILVPFLLKLLDERPLARLSKESSHRWIVFLQSYLTVSPPKQGSVPSSLCDHGLL